MKIKNIGSKIIGVGTTVLMPEDSMTVDKLTANSPAIKKLVDMKLLALDDSDERAAAEAKRAEREEKRAAKQAEKEAAKQVENEAKAAKKAEKKAAKEAAEGETEE